ncbi:hypothetical protein CWI75_03805 [Kineobactrum sediminis]|uniref:DUF4124 domain-containing protein n=1 Tax=Kineobactrum sediminis TaxID=1905677 RepID=A0A2N5Y551_9GAMM|nr:hypothetical protein [Kineobactrum sediminis]PLW83491.1 hypothetical protein CWI75_03805 [Kineobactrum sediminis]
MIGKPALLVLVTCLFCAASGLAQNNRELYRYRNSEGVVVIDFRVPPEYVASGYEVLNNRGVVIRVVAPRPAAEGNTDMNARQLAALERERLAQWDKNLKLRYSSVSDIESARDRALAERNVRIRILENNRGNLRRQVETFQARAADIERSGRVVDPALLGKIADLQQQMAVDGRRIIEREREIAEAKARFAADIARFRMLEDAPN